MANSRGGSGGVCFEVQSDGVTLDLDGRKVDGAANDHGLRAYNTAGGSYSGLRVVDGEFFNFQQAGLYFRNCDNVTLENIYVHDISVGDGLVFR